MTDKFYYLVAMLTARPERDERGATATEYALLIGGIALAIIVAVGLVGDELNSMFEDVVTKLGGTVPTT